VIYKIKNKFYIKVQGYFKEINVSLNKNKDLVIEPCKNGEELEFPNVKEYETFYPQQEYDKERLIDMISSSSTKKIF